MRNNKKLILAICMVLALTTVVAATFAWFTSYDSEENKFKTNQYVDGSVRIREVFTPPDDWQPGTEINKDVGAVNTGGGTAVVRITFTEALTKLTDGVPAFAAGNAYTGQANKAPLLFAADAYTTNSDWVKLDSTTTASFTNGATILSQINAVADSNLVLYFNKSTAGLENTYNFALFNELGTIAGNKYSDMNQSVSADFSIVRNASGIDTLTVANIAFGLLDTSSYTSDWRTTPTAVNFATVGGVPTVLSLADPGIDVSATATPDIQKQLQLIFNTNVKTTLTGIQPGDWFWNVDDGYFYYMGALASGQATEDLLDAVKLLSAADGSYSDMNYDLTVHMDGIQNTDAAVDALWGITGALRTAVLAYCK